MPPKRERILVFQPLCGSAFDYRMLGMTYWLTDRFVELGLEGASAVFTKPSTDPSLARDDEPPMLELSGSEPPTDAEIRQTLVNSGARFGLLTSFAALAGTPHLAVARLFEARRGHPLRVMARWTFDGDTHSFPAAADLVFVNAATRLGAVIRPHEWSEAFGTTDHVLASNYLTALGCYAACERGIRLDVANQALTAVMSAIVGGMQSAVRLLPELVDALRRTGSADEELLVAAVHTAVDSVAVVPSEWHVMMREAGIAGGVLN